MTTPPIFGLSSSADFLGELRETVSDRNKDPVNPRLARYVVIVSGRITDRIQTQSRKPAPATLS